MKPGHLVVACGNTLRGDDGVGWKIAEALESDASLVNIQVIATHQLTPELAEPISTADTVIFVDCSANTPPGVVTTFSIQASTVPAPSLTHHIEPASLLALAQQLYDSMPRRCLAVTVGGGSFEVSENLSEVVRMAVPAAVVEVKRILSDGQSGSEQAPIVRSVPRNGGGGAQRRCFDAGPKFE